MTICFIIGGQRHCYEIPVVEIPFAPHGPGPGPVNYPWLISDATVMASIQAAANKVTDDGARSVLQGGINAALQAIQKRGGNHISFEGTAGGPPTGGGAHGPGR